jgi:hypothetical protein
MPTLKVPRILLASFLFICAIGIVLSSYEIYYEKSSTGIWAFMLIISSIFFFAFSIPACAHLGGLNDDPHLPIREECIIYEIN